MISYILIGLIAYFVGSISFSIIFTKAFTGEDIRDKGSGNAGSTNVFRSIGAIPAVLTLICDALKGVIVIAIAYLFGKWFGLDDNGKALLVELAAIFVVVGHMFPIYYKFRGGKGVATSLGVILTINWRIGLACAVFAFIIIAITRMVSIGSIGAAIQYPVLCLFITKETFIISGEANQLIYVLFGTILAALVIWKHRANIGRLASGEENRLSFGSKNKNKKKSKKEESDEDDEEFVEI